MEIRNAQIVNTMLGKGWNGIFTFTLFIASGDMGCSVGGYALSSYEPSSQKNIFSEKGLEAISKILEVVGVDKWEQLPGKNIRIKCNGWGSTIDEIGNITRDKWFNLRNFFET